MNAAVWVGIAALVICVAVAAFLVMRVRQRSGEVMAARTSPDLAAGRSEGEH